MQWFINLSTRAKLFVSFGVVIAFLALVIITSYRGLSQIMHLQLGIYQSEFPDSVDIQRLKSNENAVRADVLTMLLVPRAEKERWHKDIKDRSERIDQIMQKLIERNRDEPQILPKLEEINAVRNEFKNTRDAELIPLIYAGKTDKAKTMILGVQAARFEKMRSISTGLEKIFTSEADRHMNESEKRGREMLAILIIIGSAAVFFSLLIALFLNRIMARPLQEISHAAERISSGDLTVKAPLTDRSDEVGALAQVFTRMMESLHKQTRDLTEAVNVLASSSNEIAATTAQLASGTEQTSIAVTETTTTVEEVKQTANSSTQKAKHVSDLAQNAVQFSVTGSRLVNETIDGINNIKEQMEYIAETIVRLSEHNQAIGEIISTVDELAEQSNLLAVNASIEASKAGEHGKGFIVVAQEIKNLAEQSKQATKQVRGILNDIQKASTAAVMATEKGSKAVEANVKQSAGTGDSIRELSKSITEASQAVMQIAASNQQQLIGMDQVALAMGNIKQASVQNAASTKQVEATVRNLQELGQRLKRMIEHYKV